MTIIGYEYESAEGLAIKKAVICENNVEYREMRRKISNAGYKFIEFDEIYDASDVLQ